MYIIDIMHNSTTTTTTTNHNNNNTVISISVSISSIIVVIGVITSPRGLSQADSVWDFSCTKPEGCFSKISLFSVVYICVYI